MKTVYARNIGRSAALGMALWALLYAHAQVQTTQADTQQQVEQQLLQKQRRQELRSMMRQQKSGPVLSTDAATVPVTPASAVLSNGPRRLSIEEKNELRRQLARDLSMAQASKP
jgi:hypothetical protein